MSSDFLPVKSMRAELSHEKIYQLMKALRKTQYPAYVSCIPKYNGKIKETMMWQLKCICCGKICR